MVVCAEDVQVGEDANGKPITESKKSPKVWESDIKPYESYLHDQDFTPGMYYDVSGKNKSVRHAGTGQRNCRVANGS